MRRGPFIAAIAGAPLLSRTAAAQTAAQAALRIATVPIDSGMQVHYAQDLGYFAKAGLTVDIETITNGAQITAAVTSGSVDIGFSNLLSIAQAYERGIALVTLFPAGLYTADAPNGGLVVAKDSPITTAKDLNGKTVGISTLGNMTQLAPMAWIDQNGGDYKSVHWIEIPSFPALQAAVEQHRIDAAFLSEPIFSAAKQSGRLLADAADAISRRFTTAAWFSTKAWAQQHPDLVARFTAAMKDASHWANTHPSDAKPMIAKQIKVPLEIVMHEPTTVFGETMQVSDFKPLLDAAAKYGLLPRPIAMDELLFQPRR